jgi:DNA invertase Pin-like site-specific DNA recombinase
VAENWDRLSRQSPWDAINTLRSIIESGIAVVIGDGEPMTRESVRNDGGMSLMMATVTYMRSHDESAAKSRRLKSVWNAKRQQAHENGKAISGRCPGWLKRVGNGYVLRPERVAVVRRIYQLAKDGTGLESIARTLTL